MDKIKVLLVENSVSTAQVFSKELERLGYSVIDVIDTGEAVVQRVSGLNPDIVLMDMMLKGEMTGLEAAKVIRKKHNFPIIFLTPQDDDEFIKEAVLSNADGYLPKSSFAKKINTAIQQVVENHTGSKAQQEFIDEQASSSMALADANVRMVSLLDTYHRIREEEMRFYETNDEESFLYQFVQELVGVIGAKYGALALFDSMGKISRFITIGIPGELTATLGSFPEGKGVLTRIYRGDGTVRINNLLTKQAATRFPSNHPQMSCLLGSSIIINNVHKGAIYLADKNCEDRYFTDSDELLLGLLIPEIQHVLERKELIESLKNERIALEVEHDSQLKLIKKISNMQDQLIQSEKMASIGQLAAGVAHEINNPIGYVSSNLNTLEKYINDFISVIDSHSKCEEEFKDKPDAMNAIAETKQKIDVEFIKRDVLELLNESYEGIDRVRKIVKDLKDFSHVDEAEWQLANLNDGINSTLNIVNNELKYKAEVIKELGDIPDIECIISQLNQVIMNLLINASHAIPDRGSITIRTANKGDDQVLIEIQDTGTGIKTENLNNIFNPFFTTKPVGKGTGLGLSLSYNIIKKHHGEILVKSQEGKGTKFTIYLPLKQPESNVEVE